MEPRAHTRRLSIFYVEDRPQFNGVHALMKVDVASHEVTTLLDDMGEDTYEPFGIAVGPE